MIKSIRKGRKRPNQSSRNTRPRKVVKAVAIPRPRAVSRLTQPGIDFLKCALDPINSKGSMGAPDSFSGMSVVVDHRMTFEISASAAGKIAFAVLPTLPGSLYIGEGNCVIPAFGTAITTPATLTMTGGDATLIGVPFSQFRTGAIIGAGPHNWDLSTASNPYSARKARVLTSSCRVTPTTQLLQASGNVYVAQYGEDYADLGYNRVYAENNGSIAPASPIYRGGTICRYSNVPDLTVPNLSSMAGYSQHYIDDGVYVVAKRADPEFEFQPWATRNTGAIANTTGTRLPFGTDGQFWNFVSTSDGAASGGTQGLNDSVPTSMVDVAYIVDGNIGGTQGDGAGPCFVDPAVNTILVAMDGLQPSSASVPTAVAIEVVLCVEYQVLPTSTVSQFQKVSPSEDPLAMRLLGDVMRRMPTALPASAVDGSWAQTIRNILTGISTGGKTLARFGLPYAGAAAELADQFGGLLL